jgi:hypothetical protein
MDAHLPSPRRDGKCVDCVTKIAETNDLRFCVWCLRKRIEYENPIPYTKPRTKDQKQAYEGDPNPWGENNVRHMEDG